MHGTVESPEAMRQFICASLEQGLSVRPGLETGRAQSAPLNNILGQLFDDNLVKETAIELWSSPDGKGTEAVLALLEQVSIWKLNDLDVSVFAYDGQPSDYRNAENIAKARDAAMAKEIDRQLDILDGVVVVLTGSFHAKKRAFKFAEQEFVPMASLITKRPVLSLNMKHGPGEAWVNASIYNEDGSIDRKVGVLQVNGNAGGDTSMRKFELDIPESEPFNGYYLRDQSRLRHPHFRTFYRYQTNCITYHRMT